MRGTAAVSSLQKSLQPGLQTSAGSISVRQCDGNGALFHAESFRSLALKLRRDVCFLQTGRQMKAHSYDLSIRVLIYRGDDRFVAHALESDILGCGSAEAAAKRELEGLLDNQLSFAACIGKPQIVQLPAPKEFFARWERANQAQLRGERLSEKSLGLHGKPAVFVYSQDDLNRLRTTARKRDFSKTEELAVA